MECTKCEKKAVYSGQGQQFCKNHFIDYFEQKVFKTIKKYELINAQDNVCVAASGGKDSLSVLYLTAKYCREYNISFTALLIDEGIKDYRDHTKEDLELFCKKQNIELTIVSFKEAFGMPLDDIRDKARIEKNKKPCTVCGIFRRTLLNRAAKALHATKLVTGHNLDDEAQSFLMNTLLGNMGHNAAMGPITGLQGSDKFVQRVKPLYFMLEKETRLYAVLKEFQVHFAECPNIQHSFRATVRDELNIIEKSIPGVKNNITNAFLEILPTLKEKYQKERPFHECKKCGDASAGEICNACKLEEELCQ